MARISGIDLPAGKKVGIALTYIYGIGKSNYKMICKIAGVSEDKKVKDLTESEILALQKAINDNLVVEGDLRREVSTNIRRLMEINCYRGVRHKRGLPVRGQRTRTNARTRKGPKKTVGAKTSKA
ncbi:MAG: 30S ribosomal protein S13 [Candidatus Cryosericum sp.]|nr:30S ribosomal protein S13 [Candidatus Cryosericum sp.]HPS70227.1 30S ribosomal protein S13 [Candidatus Cryosericum sp.]